ncbi:MAG TPA: LAGLIDADG family homing endonuclease [Blastocatellia bacterium]|nr:LAGLIDADG family homing endonuclease [Blastocatellia bacterium]
MPPEQEILTAQGYRPIAEVNVGDFVVTHRNRLRRVLHKFERETQEPIYTFKAREFSRDVLRVTGEHKILVIRSEWINANTGRDGLKLQHSPQWIPAQEIKPGDYVAAPYNGKGRPSSAICISGYAEYDELWWIEVEQITLVDYSGRVFDIEVEEDHSFISAGLVVSNCYVVPSPRDSRMGIVETLSQMMEIMSRGGGVGINVSSLRPRHSYVKGVNGRSSGSVSWGALYSFVTGLIEQGGSRRGALMIILNCWHPDVLEFINSKRDMGKITNANISVGITDKFMEAVHADADWDLIFPDTSDPDYEQLWDGNIDKWQAAGKKVIAHKTVKARHVWDAIIESAWASAEPGVFFIERANKMSNSWYYDTGYLGCTNPCVTGDTLVSVEQGYIRARDLQPGMKIRTPAGLKPIEKVFNNGAQRIYRVEFSDGGRLECTRDHKLKVVRDKKYEWVAVADLRDGDKVLVMANETFGPQVKLPDEALAHIAKRSLRVSDHYDRQLGFLVGAVLGDGSLRKLPNRGSHDYQCSMSFGAHEEKWLNHFTSVVESMNIHTHRTLVEKMVPIPDGRLAPHSAIRLECYKLATLLVKIGMPTNIKAPEKYIPERFLSMDRAFLAGILDGLFSTDGSVLMKQDNPMLRFHTSSYQLAQQVRLILLQFGIHGRIYTVEREEGLEYDGRSMYGTGIKYDVVIMNEGIARFYAEVGLSHAEKAARLKEIAEGWHYIGGSWTASVVSVEDTGREEEVFDLYEPDTLTWVTNGYMSLDCGEQPLPGFGVCNLGAINLAKFVQDGEVAWDELGQAVRYAVRFLDDVIDATPYFFEENYAQQKSERRVGLNTMGLAEMLIRLGIRYGSDESVQFLDRLYRFVASNAYHASADIAAEKGPFPLFDADKYLQSGYMKNMPEDVREAVREKGARNVTLLTQAPNGTIGTMVGTSTGIEPFYFWSYFRKSRLGQHEERVKVLEEWQQANPNQPTPNYFVTAMDLAPEEHVKVQAAIQRWVDSSISKTCNLPNAYTVEQTREIYELLYRLGCKGGTIYRDGSRDVQVLNLKEEDKKVSETLQAEPAGEAAKSAGAPKPVPTSAVQQKVRPLPYKRRGYTVSKATPSGTAHITMNEDEENQPFEVFVEIGKAGSDIKAMAEAMGRLMSLILRLVSPVTPVERVREIVKQISGIGGARSYGFGKRRVLSLPDAVGQALAENYLGLKFDNEEDVEEDAPVAAKSKAALEAKPASSADLCPTCGDLAFVRQEGCQVCHACGYSEC